MAEETVYTPTVISDNPFPSQDGQENYSDASSSGETVKAEKIQDQGLPTKRIAVELISSALNTKSKKILAVFELTESGGFQVGKYLHGVSGDIKITPVGIVARDKAGITTFTLDGETGDATFRGTIQGESLLAGLIAVGNNNVIIDGENKRIIINDGTNDRILIGYQKNGF